MAKDSGRDKPPDELKEEIALSREQVARNLRGLRYELDLPRKIRSSFRTQPVLWIGSAVVIGAVLTLLTRSGKKVYVPAKSGAKPQSKFLAMGLTIGALRLASDLLKPVVISFLQKKLGGQPSGPRPVQKR